MTVSKNKIKIERYTTKSDSVKNFEMLMKFFSVAIIILIFCFISYLLINTEQHSSSYKHARTTQTDNQVLR